MSAIQFIKHLWHSNKKQYIQALIVWGAFGLMVLMSHLFVSNIVRNQLRKEAEITISLTQTKSQNVLSELRILMAGISETIRPLLFIERNPAMMRIYMRSIFENVIKKGKYDSGLYNLCGVFDVFGGMYIDVRTQDLTPGDNTRESLWYKEAVQANGAIVLTQPYFDNRTMSFIITCACGIFDDMGNLLGVLGIHMSIDTITDYVADTHLTKSGFSMLFSKDQQTLVHPLPQCVGKMLPDLPGDIAKYAAKIAAREPIMEIELTNLYGQRAVLFVRYLENGWTLVLVTPYHEYYSAVYAMETGIIVLGIILAMILSVILMNILTAKNEADERMQIMFDAMPIGAVFYDKNFKPIDCNQSAVKLLGLASKQQYMEFGDLSPEYQPDGRLSSEKKIAEIDQTFKNGYNRLEWVYKAADGTPVPAEITAIRVEHKDDYMVLLFSRDLREIKAVLDEIRRENERTRAMSFWYESILNAVPLPITVTDMGSKCTFMNTAVEKHFGKNPAECLGLQCSHLGLSICNTMDCAIICAKKGVFQTYFSEGNMSYQVDVAILKDLGGKELGYVKVMQDVTNLKIMAKKQADAEAANFAKTNFLAKVSHELRTPLNAVLGVAEIQLQDEMLSADITEAFGRIYQSGAMLLGLINDILDLSKIEAGKLELLPNKYDTANLLKDTAQSNLLRIGSKPLSFNLQIDPAIPSELFGDELRIKQILNNLLSNAIKYTKEGWVKLTVEVDPLSAAANMITLVIRVQDTGSGMSEEQVQNLFDEYSRFNIEEHRATEGTGLGMNITKRLVDMMGGEILVESKLGKGTMITVRLPQEKMSAKEIGVSTADDLRWFRAHKKRFLREPMPYGSVLIVDDLESNIYVARGLLAPYKLAIDVAMSGAEALEKIKEGNIYDIIFMDHLMPVMDGIEAVKELRSLGYTHPVIALTANAVFGQAEMFLSHGFDGFISKPIDLRQLDAALLKYIRDKQHPEVIQAARSHASESVPENWDAAQQYSTVSPQLAEIFLRDAAKVFVELETISHNAHSMTKEDIEKSIFNFHAIKGALANIGEDTLYKLAAHLEESGKHGDIEEIQSKMASFVASLRGVIEKISMLENREEFEDELTEEDFLNEKLKIIYNACAAYDKIIIKGAMEELRNKRWTQAVSDMLKNISEHLLHSEFAEIADIVKTHIQI